MAKLLKPTVKCVLCHELYSPYFEGCAEGYHCSADIRYDGEVWCGYGSDFDTHVFKFVDGMPFLEEIREVCDGCLLGFMDQGELVFDRYYM